jgi:hypothetical protein
VNPTFLSLVALSLLAAPPEVTLRPLEGESTRGRLVELSGKQFTFQTKASGAKAEMEQGETSKLMWIELPAAVSAAKASEWIELLDGSRLQVAGYTAAEGKSQVQLTTGQTIELPTRAVHSVRFREESPELAAQWRTIAASHGTGDVLVIRKTSTRNIERGGEEPMAVTEQALDQLEGTVSEVSEGSVRFELDGEKVDVRREKLEGIVYYRPAKREFSAPICRLVDPAGSSWLLREIKLADDQFEATTLGGVLLKLPASGVAKLDFSVGNVALLDELEPDTGGGDLAVSLQPAAMSYKFSRVFQVRPRPPLGADAFRIAGKRYEGGLSLHSPVKLVYRVPEGFRRFRAVAGIDDSIVVPGRFDLVISGDGKELVRQSFAPDEPRQPIPIDLELKGIRRLTISLEAAAGEDIGDQLDLCEARFTK